MTTLLTRTLKVERKTNAILVPCNAQNYTEKKKTEMEILEGGVRTTDDLWPNRIGRYAVGSK